MDIDKGEEVQDVKICVTSFKDGPLHKYEYGANSVISRFQSFSQSIVSKKLHIPYRDHSLAAVCTL